MEPQIDVALKRIKELEEENQALCVQNDLLLEILDDCEGTIRSLKGQLWNLQQDRRYEVG